MLEHLEIRNFALIEDLSMDFSSGLNVITGETGSGKTIILSALALIMGDKAHVQYIREGAEELYVSAIISISENSELNSFLSEIGIKPDDDRILIRRIIRSNLRSTISVQGISVTRAELCKICEYVFDIHNQNEHQSLLKENSALGLLDTFSLGYEDFGSDLLDLCAKKFKRINELNQKISETLNLAVEGDKQRDYLTYAVNEIKSAKISENEDEELAEKLNVISKYELIHESLKNCIDFFSDGISKIYDASSSISKAERYDSNLADLAKRLDSVKIDSEDVQNELKAYFSGMNYSASDVDLMQERLALLQKLKRKYGGINGTLLDVINFQKNSSETLETVDNLDELLDSYKKEHDIILKEYDKIASDLSKKRREMAKVFSSKILATLRPLGMPNAEFVLKVDTSDDYASATGKDKVSFMLSANPGQALRPISEVASGGELSRVMLALKTVHATEENIQTQVFDEIDTGIGGAVAVKLADNLKELSKRCQVILVTHLATVAGKADSQYVVSKSVKNGNTYTEINQVIGEERVYEIARMLSGKIDKVSLDHARYMLES